MNEPTRVYVAATVLRLLLGWYMLVDGLKILASPTMHQNIVGFLMSAKTFPAFYAWFALPANSWWVDPLNSWGIVLIGLALLTGVGVRFASWAGVLMMMLYYFPHYAFPIVTYGYIVEEHFIYAGVFALVAVWPAAQSFGLAKYLRRTSLGKVPLIRALL